MSGGWGSYFSGRRWSPFGGAPPPATPEIRDSDYAYIAQDDIVDPPSSYRGGDSYYNGGSAAGYGRRRDIDEDDPNAPDVLIVKYKDRHFQLPFAAYSISEGRLRLGEIRRAAAERLGVSEPRRVRLLYKGRQLRDDAAAAGEEGLKQNSEIMCIVSETADDFSSSDEESPSEREMASGRIETQNSGTRRKNRKRKDRRRDERKSPATSPPVGGRDDYFQETSRDRNSSRLDARHHTTSTSRDRRPAPSPVPPAPNRSGFDPNLPSSKPEPPAFKEIADLDAKYRKEFLGPAEQLLSNPPSEAKKRDYEAIRLGEMIERDIVLKLDAIDTEGRDDIRQKRKKLVNEANAMLQRLDAAKKKWKEES